jgi:dihydroxy-acid dehydratase
LGGPLALVKDGDRIIVDAPTRQIDWLVDNETKEARRKEWETQGQRDLKVKRGVLYRYARDVAVSGRFLIVMASVLPF